MLPKRMRLSRKLFETVFSNGVSVRQKEASFKYGRLPDGVSHGRFAVVVSKKVRKTAVGRNALKRKVFAILSKNRGSLPKRDGILFVYGDFDTLHPKKQEELIVSLINLK